MYKLLYWLLSDQPRIVGVCFVPYGDVLSGRIELVLELYRGNVPNDYGLYGLLKLLLWFVFGRRSQRLLKLWRGLLSGQQRFFGVHQLPRGLIFNRRGLVIIVQLLKLRSWCILFYRSECMHNVLIWIFPVRYRGLQLFDVCRGDLLFERRIRVLDLWPWYAHAKLRYLWLLELRGW